MITVLLINGFSFLVRVVDATPWTRRTFHYQWVVGLWI